MNKLLPGIVSSLMAILLLLLEAWLLHHFFGWDMLWCFVIHTTWLHMMLDEHVRHRTGIKSWWFR